MTLPTPGILATGSGDAQPHNALSDREFDVFKCLIHGMGVNDIAEQLSISNKTVSTHKSHIMSKMEMKNQVDLVRYAISHQLIAN